MSITAYTVLAEFKFEAGSAIVQSQAVQDALDGISASADNAMKTVQGLGMSFVANFGLGASSVIGVLGQALKASDSFYKSQLVFANIMSSNMSNLAGDIGTFNDRMMVSSKILKDISKDAAKFGLPEQELAGTTKLLAGALTPKGLAGNNFENARNMGRNLLKSAPVLGVDATESMGQLLRAMQGGASGGDPLFRSLAVETAVFKQKFGGDVTKAVKHFNKLPLKERFDLLNKGLGQFAKDTDVLAGNSQTISAMMRRMSDMFIGFNGILKPIGDVLLGVLRPEFERLMKLLNTQGREAIQNFSKVLGILVQNLEGTATNLMQVKRLGHDFKSAGSMVGILLFGEFLAHMGLMTPILKAVIYPFRFLITNIGLVARVMLWLGRGLLFLAGGALKFFLAMLPLIVVFQTISRAMAKARIADLKAVPEAMSKISEHIAKLTDLFMVVFGPALEVMDAVADKLSWFFEFSMWLDIFSSALGWLTEQLTNMFAGIRGSMFAILELISRIPGASSLGINSLGVSVGDAFQMGATDFFEQLEKRARTDDGKERNVAKSPTFIDKVEINNAFKEQLEPDRIATTLKDQLMRAAMNPKSAKGRSFSTGNLSP